MASLLELEQILQELREHPHALIQWHGWKIHLVLAQRSQFCLHTIVYCGDAYVPPGVREAVLLNPAAIGSSLRTSVRLDEQTHRVTLLHEATQPPVANRELAQILEEFSWVAERWWQYLNERDRRDLIYVIAR